MRPDARLHGVRAKAVLFCEGPTFGETIHGRLLLRTNVRRLG